MTDATSALPAAGWYPDPAGSDQLRWWDGVQWHEAFAPAAPARRLGGGFSGLTTALLWLIGVQGALHTALVALYVTGLESQPKDVAYDETGLSTYTFVEMALLLPAGLLMFATIIVWCFWQHRLASFAPRDQVRRTPGWHVGSWFIPVVMLWFPFQNMKDMWRAFVGRGLVLLGWWWTLWLIANFTSNGVVRASWRGELSAWEVNLISLVDALLWALLCLLAVLVVCRLAAAARLRDDQS